jgi:hypothetical protein
MRQKPDSSCELATSQLEWESIDSTTDPEIHRQEFVDLVQTALQHKAGGLIPLAARLGVSPSSVRCWRLPRVMPSVAHHQRLHHVLTTL